jgi:homeobox protein cut-like
MKLALLLHPITPPKPCIRLLLQVVEVETLKEELVQRPTSKQVDDLRKQVKILQAVGYNSIEAEDWELATRGDDIGKLETLLLDKNRRLEHELTQAKVGRFESCTLGSMFY